MPGNRVLAPEFLQHPIDVHRGDPERIVQLRLGHWQTEGMILHQFDRPQSHSLAVRTSARSGHGPRADRHTSGDESEQQEPAARNPKSSPRNDSPQSARHGIFGHRQSLARARYLEQMKAVEAHTRLGCCRIQPGRRDRARPGAAEVPLLASDEAWEPRHRKKGATCENRLNVIRSGIL